MSYRSKIRTLEESYRQVQNKITQENNSSNPDREKLANLLEYRSRYYQELCELRRKQYDLDQEIDFDDR